ncbi:HD-GYP domain-containing protein [Ketobacter sp.]|uniref:HD-GYP domain-containing protein n=1 Tax=Ketobacter sp. TaxID=2083498 RepID=UPI000F1580F7|nr:HD domain-containing phosphohydrolase [Ketobacter sp.]RLT97400.1 MAG: HD domain-containing protein [Ketobacter sp.]
MNDSNICAENTYARRLAKLGDTREVIASEDIYNAQGALVIQKGTRINRQMSDRIVKFKLLKPIESSVNVDNALTPQELYRDLQEQIQKYPEIKQIHDALALEKPFKQLSLELVKYPVVRQKLTVMREQMRDLYNQTLCITWLSLATSRQMKLGEQQIEECFIAALCHDIGMMHIAPNILNKKDLAPAEWRQIQAHTVIGQRVLESVPKLSKRVSRIVLEHHERCDGTGYPLGKFDDQLTPESQILALCDSVFAVLQRNLIKHKRGLRDLLPFIQVNSESHFYKTYTALVNVLKKASLSEDTHLNDSNIEMEISKLELKSGELCSLLGSLERIMAEIDDETEHRPLQSSRAILNQVTRIVRGSGVLDEGYMRWLQQVKQEKLSFAYRETADVLFILNELEWQLKRVVKLLDGFLVDCSVQDKNLKEHIKTHLPGRALPEHATSEFAIT